MRGGWTKFDAVATNSGLIRLNSGWLRQDLGKFRPNVERLQPNSGWIAHTPPSPATRFSTQCRSLRPWVKSLALRLGNPVNVRRVLVTRGKTKRAQPQGGGRQCSERCLTPTLRFKTDACAKRPRLDETGHTGSEHGKCMLRHTKVCERPRFWP